MKMIFSITREMWANSNRLEERCVIPLPEVLPILTFAIEKLSKSLFNMLDNKLLVY